MAVCLTVWSAHRFDVTVFGLLLFLPIAIFELLFLKFDLIVMNRYNLSVLFSVCILIICLAACKRAEYAGRGIKITSSNIDSILVMAESDSLNVDLHDKIINYFLLSDKRKELEDYCWKVYGIGTRNDNPELIVLSSAFIAQTHILGEDYETSREYINIAKANLKRIDTPSRNIQGLIYNVSAGIAYRTDLNYPLAIEYLSRLAEMSREDKDSVNLCGILSNISSVYYTMNDSSGIKYAREAYEISCSISSDRLRVSVMLPYTQYCLFVGENEDALNYALQAVSLVDSLNYSIYRTDAYMTLGDCYLASKMYDKVKASYDTAVMYSDYAKDKSVNIKLYSGYAKLYEINNYPEKSLEMYRKALALSKESGNSEMKYQILYGIYNSYNTMGNTDSAFFYFKEYHDALFYALNYVKERKVNSIMREYQRLQLEEVLREKDVELVKKSRSNYIKMFIVIILLVISAALVVVIRNNKRNYRNTILRYEQYKQKIEEMRIAEKNKLEQVSSSRLALFDSIEVLMKDKQIFRDKSLSLDMLASVMKTSTYSISSAVNMYSGMTFPNYVNSYRIDYVLKQMSDKDNKDSLTKIFDDAGFMSKTTAYRSFQKETGCSPSAYRKLVSGN